MGFLNDLDSINQNVFQNTKRKHDETMVEVEYGTLQVLVQIRDLLLDNNNLLKSINNSVQQVSNGNHNEQIDPIKRNSGLQKRNK
ncbi:hypothetical protein LMK04_12345 (plasmid) [Lactococcus petauri]|jgi:hypothetical protein|nr:hypothetical protein LMK04_12345 [Lactococcus petauri]